MHVLKANRVAILIPFPLQWPYIGNTHVYNIPMMALMTNGTEFLFLQGGTTPPRYCKLVYNPHQP